MSGLASTAPDILFGRLGFFICFNFEKCQCQAIECEILCLPRRDNEGKSCYLIGSLYIPITVFLLINYLNVQLM